MANAHDLTLYTLTAEDIEFLRQLKADYETQFKSLTSRATGASAWRNDDNRNEAPDFYTVKAPAGGIAAGQSAFCEVYQEQLQADGTTVLVDTGFSVQVSNPSSSAIAAATSFQAQRSKFGQWQAVAGLGGGTSIGPVTNNTVSKGKGTNNVQDSTATDDGTTFTFLGSIIAGSFKDDRTVFQFSKSSGAVQVNFGGSYGNNVTLPDGTFINFTPISDQSVTGFVYDSAHYERVVYLWNGNPGGTITYKNLDSGSTAVNQIVTPNGLPFSQGPNTLVALQHTGGSFGNWTLYPFAPFALRELVKSANYSVVSSDSGESIVCTSALTLTLPHTTALTTAFYLLVFAESGNVTLSINGSDAINGGSAGTGATITSGNWCILTTDANGNWYLWGAVGTGGTSNGRVSADVTTTSNAFGNVTGMSFPIAANEIWSFEWNLALTGSMGGMRFQVTGPASPTDLNIQFLGNVAAGALASDWVTAFSTPSSGSYSPALANGIIRITGCVKNGGNPGTVQLQFASATNTQTNTVKQDSYQNARKIG